jgi:hypothetical protein
VNGTVLQIAHDTTTNTVYLSGGMTFANNDSGRIYSRSIVALNGSTFSSVQDGFGRDTSQLAVANGNLWAIGFNETFGTTSSSNIAVLRNGVWRKVPQGLPGSQFRVAEAMGKVYISGRFPRAFGLDATGIVGIDTNLVTFVQGATSDPVVLVS